MTKPIVDVLNDAFERDTDFHMKYAAAQEKRKQGYIVAQLGRHWYACKPDWRSTPQYLTDECEWREMRA